MVCTNIRLGILTAQQFVYVSVSDEGINIFKTGKFGYEPMCLCFCCCEGYFDRYAWGFCKMILLVYVCDVVEGMYTYKTMIFETSLCVYVCVFVVDMYASMTGHFGE